MPLIKKSTFTQRPFYMLNEHFETVIPSVFRKIKFQYQRERILLSDGDFLDLDWKRQGSNDLIIISHGLEGNSGRGYVTGMATIFNKEGWDVLAWNCRGCSGETNHTIKLYHHGQTEDLKAVVDHVVNQNVYNKVILLGFSMGGNLTLKYLGEEGKSLPMPVKAGIAFSTPVDLPSSVLSIEKPSNKFYGRRFLRKLKKKLVLKSARFPDFFNEQEIESIKDFDAFDRRYTCRIYGFDTPDNFYKAVSSKGKLSSIQVPTLLVNAKNDPMLGPECFPYEIAKQSKYLFLETPEIGGHTGFVENGLKETWADRRAISFVRELGL